MFARARGVRPRSALCAPASAQTIELKLSHWGPPTHVNQKVFLPWAEMIEKKSGGKLKVTVFPGGVLGKPADHWDMGAERRRRHLLGNAQLHGRAASCSPRPWTCRS